MKKRLSSTKELCLSPKQLKHFRKASFKNPRLLKSHSRVVSELKDLEKKPKISIISPEEILEQALLKKILRKINEIRVVIAPLNSLFFMNNLRFIKQNPLLESSEISEKLRLEFLKRWFEKNEKSDSFQVYLTWKQKKWYAEYQRDQVLKQKKKLEFQEFAICKICDEKVPEMNLLNHSTVCKKNEDLKEISKKNINELSNKFLTILSDLRRKHNIKGAIIKNRIHKLNANLRKIDNIRLSDEENDDEENVFPMKHSIKKPAENSAYLSEELISMEGSIECIKLHSLAKDTSKEEPPITKFYEYKIDSDEIIDETPTPLVGMCDSFAKELFNKMKFSNMKINDTFLSREEILSEATPKKKRNSCFELHATFKEINEGEARLKELLETEAERLKINKKVLKYMDILLSLVNIYVTMSSEAPSSAFVKLRQYFENNSKLMTSLKESIEKRDPIRIYEEIWQQSDEIIKLLLAQNESFLEILDVEKELKLFANPLKMGIRLTKSISRKFSINIQRAEEQFADDFLTCKPKFQESSSHFATFFKNNKEKSKENSAKELRSSLKPIIFDDSSDIIKKDKFSFDETDESPQKKPRTKKKTITIVESQPRTQERAYFHRNSVNKHALSRSKTHVFSLEKGCFGIPSYNIIENFVNDNSISFMNKKKALKAVLDGPICWGGNYIDSYNSDGVLTTLKKKREGRKKTWKDMKNCEESESGSSSVEGDDDVCYLSDQMEKHHIHAVKLNENK